jgi:hypothetical protein
VVSGGEPRGEYRHRDSTAQAQHRHSTGTAQHSTGTGTAQTPPEVNHIGLLYTGLLYTGLLLYSDHINRNS